MRVVWLVALFMALIAPLATAAPLELYGRLPTIAGVAISGDGAKLGVVLNDGDSIRITVQDIASGKVTHTLSTKSGKVRGVQWAGPEHLIIVTSRTAYAEEVWAPRSEWFMAADYDLRTSKFQAILDDVPYAMNVIVDAPEIRFENGKPVVLLKGINFQSDMGVVSLFRVELDRHRGKVIALGSKSTRDWVIDAAGAPLAQSLYDKKTDRWSLLINGPQGWREALPLKGGEIPPALLGLGRDGRSVLVREFVDGGDLVREVSPEGVVGAPQAIQESDRPLFDPKTHQLIGYAALVGEDDRYTFFNEHDQKVWAAIRRAYPDQRIRVVDWSEDRQQIILWADSRGEGPGYALVDLAHPRGGWLGGSYAALKPADIAPVRTLRFKAGDGAPLTGYLTLPVGVAPTNLPLVVMPHGGPAARDEPGFDWWAQGIAARGYAVLQVNFRGSDGFGWEFTKAGFGEWGRKMQTDLSDGVRAVSKDGTVDPKRVCIVGASYGGYAALAGAAFDPGVYRCAASYSGVTDLSTFVPWVKQQSGERSQRYLIRFLGAESARDPSLAEISPARHADKISVPILLIHGKDDTVVPLFQTHAMASALKAAGKPVEVLELNLTDHWLSNGETRLAMLKAMVAFLEKHNPPH